MIMAVQYRTFTFDQSAGSIELYGLISIFMPDSVPGGSSEITGKGFTHFFNA